VFLLGSSLMIQNVIFIQCPKKAKVFLVLHSWPFKYNFKKETMKKFSQEEILV